MWRCCDGEPNALPSDVTWLILRLVLGLVGYKLVPDRSGVVSRGFAPTGLISSFSKKLLIIGGMLDSPISESNCICYLDPKRFLKGTLF